MKKDLSSSREKPLLIVCSSFWTCLKFHISEPVDTFLKAHVKLYYLFLAFFHQTIYFGDFFNIHISFFLVACLV